jgi:S1-C subfamily serine protease
MLEEVNVMKLSESYEFVRESIVALSLKDVPTTPDLIRPGIFPTIFATGFIVREDGLIFTNDHVIEVIRNYIINLKKPVIATLFKKFSLGFVGIPFDVIGVLRLKASPVEDVFEYGPKIPDIGFIRIRQRGLPTVKLNDKLEVLREGVEVGTAGYPLGNIPFQVNQSVGPTLQRGIISAVFPFPGSNPHSFAINVMSHGGASGSPVFLSDNGEVIGILYGGLKITSNFTYVIPATYLTACLSMDLTKVGLNPLGEDVQHFEETIKNVEQHIKEGYEKYVKKTKKS